MGNKLGIWLETCWKLVGAVVERLPQEDQGHCSPEDGQRKAADLETAALPYIASYRVMQLI